jgi:outer membrane protein
MLSTWAARFGLFSLVLASAGIVSAQSKVGIVDMRRAILETAEIKKASADMEGKYKPRQDQVVAMQKQIQDIQTQLQQAQNGQSKLTQAQATDLQGQGQRRERELKRLTDDLQTDFEYDRNAILGKAQGNMVAIVKKIAEDKGLDIVVDSNNTIYYKAPLDVTNDAITAYNAAHPAK